MPDTIRIMIADDHALFREGLRAILHLHDDLELVAEVGRVDDIEPALERTACDLLLLDLAMDRNTLPEIAGFVRRTRVVVVTGNEATADADAAIQAGALGVVCKRFVTRHLFEAIREASAGRKWSPAGGRGPTGHP